LYRKLVDNEPGPVTNGLASLYVSDVLRNTCPEAAFRAVKKSCEQETQTMMCIGSNLKHFTLTSDALAKIADMLGMQPHDAEWCFSNQMKSHFVDYESDGEWSTDEESAEESIDEPLTDDDEGQANTASIVGVEEWAGRVSDDYK
jgi:hypothetical protein